MSSASDFNLSARPAWWDPGKGPKTYARGRGMRGDGQWTLSREDWNLAASS